MTVRDVQYPMINYICRMARDFIKVRDAILTEGAMELVINKKRELEDKNGHCPMQRGTVVNVLLKEYHALLKKQK